jgi:hypothetical protein
MASTKVVSCFLVRDIKKDGFWYAGHIVYACDITKDNFELVRKNPILNRYLWHITYLLCNEKLKKGINKKARRYNGIEYHYYRCDIFSNEFIFPRNKKSFTNDEIVSLYKFLNNVQE